LAFSIHPSAINIPRKYAIFSFKTVGFKEWILLDPAETLPSFRKSKPLPRSVLSDSEMEQILKLPQVREYDLTHQKEHSIEVQLPFLQEVLDDFSIVPIVVGSAESHEVSEVIKTLWGGDETLIIISSDLSHYYDYETARLLDKQTCTAIESLDHHAINHENACGRIPIKGLLVEAERRNMQVTTLDVRNSGDTAGSKDKVVGYGAWMFEEI